MGRAMGQLVGGGKVVVDRNGRVRQQSVTDAAEWTLSWDELGLTGGTG